MTENLDNAVLMKIGELGARVNKGEQEVKALQDSVEEIKDAMATRDQLNDMAVKLDEISKWMNKGSGAMWLLATIIPGGIYIYVHWGGIKTFIRTVLGIH
jgi:hypothetical protein